MASASPTDGRSAREHRDRSGEAFEPFDGGGETLADSMRGRWRRRSRGTSRHGRGLRDARKRRRSRDRRGVRRGVPGRAHGR